LALFPACLALALSQGQGGNTLTGNAQGNILIGGAGGKPS
jgi:hypothetical protein